MKFVLLFALPLLVNCASFPKLETVEWKSKNIIVVLGMRTERLDQKVVLPTLAQTRVEEADRLYRQCKETDNVCLLLASGGDPAKHRVTEAELIRRELVKAGVPQSDILVEGKSVSTYHNAKYSSEIIRAQSPDLIILVTSGPHMRRALAMFTLFGLRPRPAPAEVVQ